MDSAVLAAVASPRRREILRLLWEGERSAGQVRDAMPDVTFGAVSLQLGALERAGVVVARREGRNRYYRARPEVLGPIAAALEEMWGDLLWRLKLAAELEQSRRGPRPGAGSPRGARRAPSKPPAKRERKRE
jgi:DNA-binding transcriptional ArsR family regulator